MSSPVPSSRSSRVASSSTSACAASCPRRSSSCAASATSRRTSARRSRRRSSSSTRTATTSSCRAALCSSRRSPSRAPSFLNNLHKGQVRKGVVSSIVNFGAFVDLGGVDGLVHVSELSWKHIEHASEVVEVGQEVTVEILEVDLERERVSLSLKATQEDPWQVFARTHAIGQVAPGQGHQARSVRCVRSRRRRHRGPRAHLGALGQARRARRAGRLGRRRGLRQGHRHRPRASPHLALAQAGERVGRPRAAPSSTRPSTAWSPSTTRTGSTSTPRASTPRPTQWKEGFGRRAREVGAGVRRCPGSLGAAQGCWSPRPLEAEAAAPTETSSASSSFSSRQLRRRHPRRRRGARRASREALGSLILASTCTAGRHLRVAALSLLRGSEGARRLPGCPPENRAVPTTDAARRCSGMPRSRSASVTSPSRASGPAVSSASPMCCRGPAGSCGSRLGIRYPSGWLCAVCEWRHGDLIDHELPPPRVDVVYYLRYDERVKIGTSSNPRQRARGDLARRSARVRAGRPPAGASSP